MPPVGAFIAALATSGSLLAAGAAFVAAGSWAALGSFILTQVVLWGVGKLLAPKQSRGGERQADTLTLSLGENPREAVFGMVATGGQLVDCWNHDSGTGDARKNRAEVLVIKLADHEVQSLEGMYVNDEYHAFTGDGDVAAFVISGFGWGLRVYFRAGTTGQTPPSFITSNSGGKWTSAKTMAGCAHVFVVYADNKDRTIWPGGRPRFSWVVKGAKLYDPRKDSTVAGGSGSHVWGTPSTYEWSENAYLIRYNWVRGIYNDTQLMVGRGLTAEEAPPERAISRANICDEDVTLKAGGTEKRYRAGGVIKSTDTAIDVEEWLAASMAGLLVDRDGVIDIDPGVAQSTVFSITDADFVAGREIQYSPHLNENQRLNTVVARWIDRDQRYADVSTAPRKDSADITADGRPYDVTIDLPFVLSGTQAQRIAEIRRRQGRLERVFSLPLGPKFIGLETGDWVTLQSDRYLGGSTITAVATAVALGEDWQVNAAFREINTNVYAWTAASDEQTKGTVLAASTAAPGAIVVDTFTATASTLTTSAGTDPAIYCTWLSFEDGAVSGIEFQVRKNGDTKITTTLVEDTTSLEAFVTSGVGAQGSFDIRARGVSRVPGRTSTWTSWTTVTTGGSSYDNDAVRVGGQNLFTKAQWRASTYAAGASFVESGMANGVSGWGLTISATNPAFAVATTATRAWLSGQDITISFIAWRTSGANPAYLEVDLYPDTLPGTGFNVTNVPQKFTWTFSSTHADMASAALRFFSNVTAAIQVTDIMVERGNKNSDWVPAPGDSDNALVPAGNANRVRYARMEAGTYGYAVLYNPSALANIATDGTSQGLRFYKADVTFTGSGQTISIGMSSTIQPIPVRGSERISVQFKVESTGPCSQIYATLWFLNSAGGVAGTSSSAPLSGAQSFGTDFKWFVDVPAAGVIAFIELYYVSSGAGAGSITLIEPSVSGARPNQTVFPDFVPGPGSEIGANVTETRVAQAISMQGGLATRNDVLIGTHVKDSAGTVRLDDDLLNVRAGFAPRKTWWFESGDEGWIGSNGSIAAANGLLTLTPSAADACIYNFSTPNLLGRLIPKVRIRARLVSGSSAWEGTLFYVTAGHGTSYSYYKSVAIPPGWTANQWCVIEFDMTALTAGGSDWVSNTITGLRVDLSNASNSVIEYDWISVGDYSSDPVTIRGITDNADKTSLNVAASITGQAAAATDATIETGATRTKVTLKLAVSTSSTAIYNTSTSTWVDIASGDLTAANGSRDPFSGGFFDVTASFQVYGDSTLDRDGGAPGTQSYAEIDWQIVITNSGGTVLQTLTGGTWQTAQYDGSISSNSPWETVSVAATDFANTSGAGDRKIKVQIKRPNANTTQVGGRSVSLTCRYLK